MGYDLRESIRSNIHLSITNDKLQEQTRKNCNILVTIKEYNVRILLYTVVYKDI